MGCGCKKPKKLVNFTNTGDPIVVVNCLDCSGPLLGLDNIYYPVNVIAVAVPTSYLDHWKQTTYHTFKVVL